MGRMGKAKRAHQFHDAGRRQSFEDGRQSRSVGDRIEFCPQDAKTRKKDREKNLSPQAWIVPINSSEFLVFLQKFSSKRTIARCRFLSNSLHSLVGAGLFFSPGGYSAEVPVRGMSSMR